MREWFAQAWTLFSSIGVAGREARAIKRELQARRIELLRQNLSPTQRAQYEARGYFEVVGGDTGTRYRIQPGWQMNVEELDNAGQRVRLLCFLPQGRPGIPDVMLVQKIALELFEDEVLKIANKSLTNFSRSNRF